MSASFPPRGLPKGPIGNCSACRKQLDTLKRCGACGIACYCGTQCQKSDWPKHKDVCQRMTTCLRSSNPLAVEWGQFGQMLCLRGREDLGSCLLPIGVQLLLLDRHPENDTLFSVHIRVKTISAGRLPEKRFMEAYMVKAVDIPSSVKALAEGNLLFQFASQEARSVVNLAIRFDKAAYVCVGEAIRREGLTREALLQFLNHTLREPRYEVRKRKVTGW